MDDLLRSGNLEDAARLALSAATSEKANTQDRTIEEGIAQLKRMHNMSPLRFVLNTETEAIREIVLSPTEHTAVLVTGRWDFFAGTPAGEKPRSGAVQLWDLHSGRHIAKLADNGPTTLPGTVVFSTNGELVAVNRLETGWKVFSASKGNPIPFPGAPEYVGNFAFGADYRALIGDGNSTRVLDLSGGQVLAELKYEGRPIVDLSSALMSPDGEYVLGLIDDGHVVHLWRAKTGEHVAEFEAGDEIADLKFVGEKSSHILSMSSDGLIRIWRVAQETTPVYEIRTTVGQCDAYGGNAADANMERGLLIVSRSGCSRLFSFKANQYVKANSILDAVTSMSFLRQQDAILIESKDGPASVISAQDFRQLASFEKPETSYVGASPDGWIAIGSHDNVRMHSTTNGSPLAELRIPNKELISALAVGHSIGVVGGFDGTARIFEMPENREVHLPVVAEPSRQIFAASKCDSGLASAPVRVPG